MAEQLNGLIMFDKEQYGYDKEQVVKYVAEIHGKYYKLLNENLRLKKKIKNMKAPTNKVADSNKD